MASIQSTTAPVTTSTWHMFRVGRPVLSLSQNIISAYVVFFGEKILESASIRSSGTRTAPSRTSPP